MNGRLPAFSVWTRGIGILNIHVCVTGCPCLGACTCVCVTKHDCRFSHSQGNIFNLHLFDTGHLAVWVSQSNGLDLTMPCWSRENYEATSATAPTLSQSIHNFKSSYYMDCTSLSLTSTDFFQLYITAHSEEIKVVVLYHIATPSSLFKSYILLGIQILSH